MVEKNSFLGNMMDKKASGGPPDAKPVADGAVSPNYNIETFNIIKLRLIEQRSQLKKMSDYSQDSAIKLNDIHEILKDMLNKSVNKSDNDQVTPVKENQIVFKSALDDFFKINGYIPVKIINPESDDMDFDVDGRRRRRVGRRRFSGLFNALEVLLGVAAVGAIGVYAGSQIPATEPVAEPVAPTPAPTPESTPVPGSDIIPFFEDFGMPPVTPQIAIPESTIPDVIPVPGGGFTGSLPIPSNETLGPLMTAIAGMMATLQAMASRAAGAPPVGVGGIGALRRMRPMGGGGMMTVPDRFFHLMSNTDSQNDIPSGMRKLTLEAKEIIFEADKFDFIQKTIMRATTNDMLTNASFSSGDTGTDTLIGSSGGDYISGSVPGGGGSSMNGSVVSPGTSVSEDNTATPGAIGQSTGLTGSPATPGMAENAGENRGLIINALTEAGITDPRAQANILGIVQSESGMVPQSENMNYRDPERMLQLFPSRIKSVEEARQLIAGGPEAIANALYGGEWGARNLGNTENGDGWKYRGRGYIQLTGRSNYAAASKALGIDLIGNPDLANDPAIAAKLIPWYYLQNRRINVADLSNMDIVMDATGNTTADMRETRRRNAAEQYSMLQGGSAPTGMSPGADVATNLSDYLTNLSKNITMEIEGMPARTTSPATVATTSITNVSSPAYQRVDEPLAAVDKMFDKLLDDMFV